MAIENVAYQEAPIASVVTDVGTPLKLNLKELQELFHQSKWGMDIQLHLDRSKNNV